MIVITGSAGFIGSCLISKFNSEGVSDIVLVDDFSKKEKEKNYSGKRFIEKVERDGFMDWFKIHLKDVTYVIHIGARTDTTEFNKDIFDKLNVNFSKDVWNICTENN